MFIEEIVSPQSINIFFLQGIELGNYLIKEVAQKVISEFPMINELSTLSPIPNFSNWLLEKMKQGNYYCRYQNKKVNITLVY